ncbi:MAG: serine dehydratase [Candidatus Marinimicrobia bacterium]|nr:serine dehydratase [Candidatus Neomarinimicrobiota bacterium]|tara:strand:+ start:2144 stop:3097 length:954 start_codon:yes stop_codon:yes gene_type:complete
MKQAPSLNDIYSAADRILPYAHITPVMTSSFINKITQSEIYFKCENFQKVGAFKFRGACNTVFSLTNSEAIKGVGTHSSGNHAAAVAFAAKLRGIKAHVVMPKSAPEIKKEAVASYGADITFCEPTLEAREITLKQVINKTGAFEIHPFDEPRVIAGQGTATLELLKEIEDLDAILTPIGGGGLICGTAIAATKLNDSISIIGTEPKNADDAYQSFKLGTLIPQINPNTIADGLRTSLSELTFSIIKKYVDEIITVTEEEIIHAMQIILERMKIVVEPSCAVPLAAVLKKNSNLKNKKIGIILTGGNVDLQKLSWNK